MRGEGGPGEENEKEMERSPGARACVLVLRGGLHDEFSLREVRIVEAISGRLRPGPLHAQPDDVQAPSFEVAHVLRAEAQLGIEPGKAGQIWIRPTASTPKASVSPTRHYIQHTCRRHSARETLFPGQKNPRSALLSGPA